MRNCKVEKINIHFIYVQNFQRIKQKKKNKTENPKHSYFLSIFTYSIHLNYMDIIC